MTWYHRSRLARVVPGHARDPVVRHDVGFPGSLHYMTGKRRRWLPRGSVPARLWRSQPVAYVLLVKRWLARARPPLLGRPEAGRVRGQQLIAEPQRAIGVDPEFELGAGHDQA